jgi:CubicO group peptidase (beta-lactamase class C family)
MQREEAFAGQTQPSGSHHKERHVRACRRTNQAASRPTGWRESMRSCTTSISPLASCPTCNCWSRATAKPVHHFLAGTLRYDGTPMREDAVVRIASMTKPVTSIAFMQLVERGLVALDDPVARIIPEFDKLDVYAGGGGEVPFATGTPSTPMRFVDLMTHMAGLTYGFQERSLIDAAYRDAKLDFARDAITSDEYIATLARLPLEFAPGASWNYSVATDVLGVAVERLSGLRLGDYFRQHIFEPLGMADTAFHVPTDKADRLAIATPTSRATSRA